MKKEIDLEKCPTLASWIGDKEGLLNAYLGDLQRTLPDLLAAQDYFEGLEKSDENEAIGRAARVMGCIAYDMKKISKEVFDSKSGKEL